MPSVTFITSLLECTDNPIQQARIDSYLESAEKLLNLDINLIVYVNPHLYPRLFKVARKPVYFIPIATSDLPAYQHIDKITLARQIRRYNPDPRNTPQYFAVTSSKHWMVQNAISLDPFNSDRFFWVDLGINKTCHGIDQATFDSIANWSGEAIRTGALRIYPDRSTFDREWYYQFGRPGLVGTLWGGSKDNMTAACNLMLALFYDLVANGYGHADEQIMYEAFERRPDLFDLYPADYGTLTRNFTKVTQISNVFHCIRSAKESGRVDILNKLMHECLSSDVLSMDEKNLLKSA